MTSLILQTTTRFMFPLLLLFSVFLLIRGHNDPGGGFAGGLVGASAFTLYALAYSVVEARHVLWVAPRSLFGSGLLVALVSGAIPLMANKPFLSHRDYWVSLPIRGLGTLELGTPFFFDLGVYLVVLGVSLTITLSLAEE